MSWDLADIFNVKKVGGDIQRLLTIWTSFAKNGAILGLIHQPFSNSRLLESFDTYKNVLAGNFNPLKKKHSSSNGHFSPSKGTI